MILFPAIDLYGAQAVRLYKGDYAQMTVYSDDPPPSPRRFATRAPIGCTLWTSKRAGRYNRQFPIIEQIVKTSGLNVEAAGGIPRAR
jgi:phosphoribosylformimino-5-aminoimidazole carboxamide ribotide isomerase